jgi:hypothetical protein
LKIVNELFVGRDVRTYEERENYGNCKANGCMLAIALRGDNSPAANDLSPKFSALTLSLTSNDKLIELDVSIVGRSSSKALYSGRSPLGVRSSILGLEMLSPVQVWQQLNRTAAVNTTAILDLLL